MRSRGVGIASRMASHAPDILAEIDLQGRVLRDIVVVNAAGDLKSQILVAFGDAAVRFDVEPKEQILQCVLGRAKLAKVFEADLVA